MGKQKFATRAEAIAHAIDESEPWAEITIHDKKCTSRGGTLGCVCHPIIVVVVGDEKKQKMGFKPPYAIKA